MCSPIRHAKQQIGWMGSSCTSYSQKARLLKDIPQGTTQPWGPRHAVNVKSKEALILPAWELPSFTTSTSLVTVGWPGPIIWCSKDAYGLQSVTDMVKKEIKTWPECKLMRHSSKELTRFLQVGIDLVRPLEDFHDWHLLGTFLTPAWHLICKENGTKKMEVGP